MGPTGPFAHKRRWQFRTGSNVTYRPKHACRKRSNTTDDFEIGRSVSRDVSAKMHSSHRMTKSKSGQEEQWTGNRKVQINL